MATTRPPGGNSTVLAAAASPSWKNRGIARRGVQVQYRVNTALRRASDTGLYPVRLEVGVALREPSYNGLPTAAEQRRLTGVEEALLGVVAGRAVLTGVMTTAGWRRFIFYAETGDWAGEIGPAVQAAAAGPVGVHCEPDPQWRVNRRLQRGAARTRILGLTALCLYPLVNGALAYSSYGRAWGIAGFAAPVLMGVLIWRLRKGPAWYLAHPVVMFSLYALLFAVLFSGVVARVGHPLHLPARGSALASLVVGVAVTASIWRAQRSFWRQRLDPDAPG